MSATAWSTPIRRAAPPAEALYSRASPGAPWLVSDPIARLYFIIFDRVRPIDVWIAAVPALHANSKSAAVITGAEPIASATIVAVGLPAYRWDSEPTEIAPISLGAMSNLAIHARAASTELVVESSSRR